MRSMRFVAFFAAVVLGLIASSRKPSERIEADDKPLPISAPETPAPVQKTEVVVSPATAASLPVVGDPLGLLSKKPGAKSEASKRSPSALEPGALSSLDAKPNEVQVPERDPRAVARASSTMIDRRAPTTIRDVSMTDIRNAVLARPAPHVLYFYGAYCPACREVMPKFVQAVRGYGGPAQITAVSIDDDREAFSSYIPALGGVIEPLLLIRKPGELREGSEALGVIWGAQPGRVSIPHIAVFDARGRVVRQGKAQEVARLEKTLREL